ncbi:hypothetical protein BH09ACT12_BH09ACT12_04540 [soil metagenome]
MAVVAVLALAGCSGGEPDQDSDEPGRPAAAVRETWPLTGLSVDKGSAALRHPVLVLKMDNTASSSPQLGLSSADLVVEELVEGGVTRLAAFYYSNIPGVVGPVRSMRASDIGIVSPVDATMVTSGAAQQTISLLAKAAVPFVTEGSAGFFRESSRSAPYNLMTDLGDVADATRTDSARPADYLPFGPAKSLPKGDPAGSFAARFSPAHTTTWEYRDGTYVDDGSLAAAGDEFPADSVLVLRVEIGDAGYLDPAGNTVPETKFVGDGDALLFHGGREVAGSWSKSALDASVALTRETPKGRTVALRVPPGHTWIELVPVSGGVDVSP